MIQTMPIFTHLMDKYRLAPPLNIRLNYFNFISVNLNIYVRSCNLIQGIENVGTDDKIDCDMFSTESDMAKYDLSSLKDKVSRLYQI